MTPIPFSKPFIAGRELEYVAQAVAQGRISGNGGFTRMCQEFLETRFGFRKTLMTTSCTSALEMCALLSGVGPGDEVVLPSYTFVSTANPFFLRGARLVFADMRPDTLNIDESGIEALITPRTKVICVMHYAGVSCEMDAIMQIALKHNLLVVEDAAQGPMATYNDRPLGGIGHLGAYSFHETKNIIAGEGGALLVNDPRFVERAEIIWEKGTDRCRFVRGEVDKYTWVDVGSSFLPSELVTAFLYAQLEHADAITAARLGLWEHYHRRLLPLQERGVLRLAVVPPQCRHNGHMFYVILNSTDQRNRLSQHLKQQGIGAVFHYVPLHTSPMGLAMGYREGMLPVTEDVGYRLLRLPMFYGLTEGEQERVVGEIEAFFDNSQE